MSNLQRRSKRNAQAWPYVKFSDRDNAWMVDARTKEGGQRKFFKTKTEATTFADICRSKRENEGRAAFENSELKSFGKTVQQAIDFYLAHLRAQQKSVTVKDAMEELILARRASGRSER